MKHWKPLKEYRGITWVSNNDLAKKLGVSHASVNYHRSKGKTHAEIIDYYTKPDSAKEAGNYRGISWTSDRDLSRKLGKSSSFVWSHLQTGKTREEIIDTILNTIKEYKGISWTSDRDLSRKLDKPLYFVNSWHHRGKSYEEIIDMVLDKVKEYKGITWKSARELARKLCVSNTSIIYHRKQGKTYDEIIDYFIANK